jgi:hypothetical protein
VIKRLNIPDSFDCILIGDGSGSVHGRAVGWTSTMLLKGSWARKVFWGCANSGTVNFSELMAYVEPLLWYLKAVKTHNPVAVRHVYIITDSQHVAEKGNVGLGAGSSIANCILWDAFSLISRQGIRLHWCWAPRSTVGLNIYADSVSRAARLLVQNSGLLIDIAKSGLRSEVINPWT